MIEVCQQCHGLVDDFEEVGRIADLDGDGQAGLAKAELDGLKDRLDEALQARGRFYARRFPFFFRTGDPSMQIPPNANEEWTEAELIAAFNLRYVDADEGAYVHNLRYAAQILRDSLEHLAVFTSSTATIAPSLPGVRPATVEDRPAVDYAAPMGGGGR
jgi:hypothetical protein